jgi:hypothetical protein
MKRFGFYGSYLTVLYWCGIIIVSILITVLLTLFHKWVFKNWLYILGAIPTLWGFFLFLYETFKPFKMSLLKAKAILLNRQVSWSLNSNFSDSKITVSTFNQLKECLRNIGTNRTPLVETDYDFSIQIDGLIIICNFSYQFNESISSTNTEDYIGKINIFIPEYRAPYVETNYRLQEEVLPIFNQIVNSLGLSNLKSSFDFDVIFRGRHPFMGMYIKDISQKEIIAFSCEFTDSPSIQGVKEKNIVSVGKNKMSFHTEDLFTLNKIISKHLFLSGG